MSGYGVWLIAGSDGESPRYEIAYTDGDPYDLTGLTGSDLAVEFWDAAHTGTGRWPWDYGFARRDGQSPLLSGDMANGMVTVEDAARGMFRINVTAAQTAAMFARSWLPLRRARRIDVRLWRRDAGKNQLIFDIIEQARA